MKERRKNAIPLLGFFLCPVLTIILVESYTHNPFATMKLIPWILNLIFYWLFAAFLLFLTGRLRVALWIETGFFMIAGLANYYVWQFRSSPILPWDIFSIGTAASVADNFSYALPASVVWTLIGFAVLLIAEFFVRFRVLSFRRRIFGAITAALLIAGFTTYMHQDWAIRKMKLYDKLFTPDTIQVRNGCAVAFIMELKYLVVSIPGGYDAEAVETGLQAYEAEDGTAAGDSTAAGDTARPNIIVIMNEAFSDMGVIGAVETNEDYMPYLHSLEEGAQENVITGKLHVSVLGGNTADTEFEFLTGNTMKFFPDGSIPYQQYITGAIPSLPAELKKQGYATVGMHPYHAKGWSRDKVYPLLGFDRTLFKEDFINSRLVRKYVDDQSDYEQVIREFEGKEKGKPLFLFNVTMQNHGGYSDAFDNFQPDVLLAGKDAPAANQYLSLIKMSDQALQDLVAYFAAEKEPTMIVFFGDHQPNGTVANPIWRANGVDPGNLTEEQESLRYQVPFLIWANFDIQEQRDVELSVNFLGDLVLQQSGLKIPAYWQYLTKLSESYPVITAKEVMDSQGNRIGAEAWKKQEELLTYEQYQYYQMFDAKQ